MDDALLRHTQRLGDDGDLAQPRRHLDEVLRVIHVELRQVPVPSADPPLEVDLLRRQVTLPALIGLIQLVMAVASIINGDAPAAVLLWLVPALLVGFAFGRATRIIWDSETYQAVLVGGQVILTLAWLAVQVGSRPVLARALGDLSFAGAITMLMAGGLVIGHSLALLGRIGQALPSPDD